MDTVIELEIGRGHTSGTFVVHVLRSPSGSEPSATVILDVDQMIAGLPQLESSIIASSVNVRRLMTTGESAVQTIGARLFDAVFTGKVGEAYRASAAVAAQQGLLPQVTLRLTAPSLAALPWEALFDSEAGRYISRKEPLVRRVSAPYTADPVVVTPPLRILGMVSAPRGLQMLDVESEKERLRYALREHLAEGQVELTWLDDVTWGGIQNQLLREPWHVLHFVGHGGYDIQADEGLVALVGRDGQPDFVPASKLADLLMQGESAPRLVVLNSCQSGATGSSDLFAGTAATLVRSGIHAVVAMQFAVTDYAAVAFARSFYVALASGRRIGEAVRSGRIGILGTARDTLEWITPVLYLREDDARLLDAAAPDTRGRKTAGPTAPEPQPAGQPAPEDGSPTQRDLTGSEDAAPVRPSPTEAEHENPAPAKPEAPSAPTTDLGTESESGTESGPASPPGVPSPIRPAPLDRTDGSTLDHRRWPVIASTVAAVVLAGGLVWGALAAWEWLTADGGGGPPTPAASGTPTPDPTPDPTSTIDPAVQLPVPAALAWTESGVSCGAGDSLAITATGTILHEANPNSTVTPDGLLTAEGLPEPYFQQWNVPGLPDSATASLIGSLDEQEPFFVGSSATYVCPRAGELFLGINDIGLLGNSGVWDVTVVKTDNLPLD
jgi:CHAT domain